MKPVYADYASATPIEPAVSQAMHKAMAELYANPSSVHSFGQAANVALERARQEVARFLNANSDEVIFTSSATESNNLAILGYARANRNSGDHIVSSTIEHPSVHNAMLALERDGFKVTLIKPDSDGLIDPEELSWSVTAKTILVSLHLANSEIGVIHPISDISAKIKRRFGKIVLHCDASQAAAWLDLNVSKLGVDLLSFNGSKIYAPHGQGVLYLRDSINISPLFYGGAQQQGLRSGTEDVPGIVGLCEAVKIVSQRRTRDFKRIRQLRDQLIKKVERIYGVRVLLKNSPKLPNYLNVVVADGPKGSLVNRLDELNVAVSAGSACSSRSLNPPQSLLEIGLSPEEANRTVRITLGRHSTKSDVDRIAIALNKLVD